MATWHVTGQLEQQKIDPSGQVVDGMTIMYQTGDGVSGTVWLPMTQYTTENVRRAIAAKAALNADIASLSSGTE